jgi:transposase
VRRQRQESDLRLPVITPTGQGRLLSEGWIPATRYDLDYWMKSLPQPWTVAMEATMFTGWIYDHLKPHAAALKVASP